MNDLEKEKWDRWHERACLTMIAAMDFVATVAVIGGVHNLWLKIPAVIMLQIIASSGWVMVRTLR